MLVSLSVLHAEVVTFLCTRDKPNSFPSPLSPDLDKEMTVVPLHKVLQAVKQLRWKAPASQRELVLGKELEIWTCVIAGDWGKVERKLCITKQISLQCKCLAEDLQGQQLTSFPGL